MRRLGLSTLLAAMWLLVGSGVAAADPPGPTDYLSEVTETDPATPGIDVEIIGGDSFVLLTVEPGITVVVVGYTGEPYLRFLSDGTVEENKWSPSKYLNEDRYADSDLPEGATADATPEWIVVADDGSFAWHDHRTHWMNDMAPPGRGPGDTVAEGVIPLLVDSVEVDVTVVSIWQEPPSATPVALGFTLGLFLGYAVVRRRGKVLIGTVLGLAVAATFSGFVAYLAVPAETSPPWSLWVFPFTAALLAASVFVGWPRLRREQTLLLIAALELVAWGVMHWGWLWAAILPTTLPFWLDRFVAATVLVGALGAAAAVVAATAVPERKVSFRPVSPPSGAGGKGV